MPQFTKSRWALTLIGLILYAVDIVSDFWVGAKHLQDGNITWGILTIAFVLCASVCTQIFSYTWFRDDSHQKGQPADSCDILTGLHVTQMGIFTRYFQLLRRSFQALRSRPPLNNGDHHELFGLAADLSMLRLFEAFLESVPQLLLQLYILLLREGHASVLQCISMTFSFFNVAWSVVDYQRCLRRSVVQLTEMPCGLPTIVYLLYKLFAISARIFSLSLLLALSPFTILYMALVWFLCTVWAFALRTNFCNSRALEYMYRAIVGVILVFTFFNIKGQRTKVPMIVYYMFYVLQCIAAPFILYVFKPDMLGYEYTTPAIAAALLIGLGLLCVYYAHLHPRRMQRLPDKVDVGLDEVDGQEGQEDTTRMRNFLQI